MPSTAQGRVAYLLNLLGPFLGLLLVTGLFCIKAEVREVFLTGGNFKIILTQTVIVASCALGMTMIIVSGGIDLSVGSSVALTSVLGATLLVKGWPPIAVVLLMISAGGLFGFVNGVIISGLRMMPFIVTRPRSGSCRPVTTLNSVVFPAPFGPMMSLRSPGITSSETPFMAGRPPKDFLSSRSCKAGVTGDSSTPSSRAQRGGALRARRPPA